MILFLFLNLLNCCLLIIPEKIIPPSDNGDSSKNCPCDLTYQTCDRNCECDDYCSQIDGGYDANNEYKKPGSHPFENKYETLLPMCSDLDKSTITDLYNPLNIGYQILKRGLCLFKDTVNNDDTIHYEDSLDEINKQLDLDNVKDDSDSENNRDPKSIDDSNNSYDIYDNLNIPFPIMLPDGSCLKNAYYVKFLQDKKVICLDKIDETEINELKNKFNISYYYITNDTYLDESSSMEFDNVEIKKILFEIYVKKKKIDTKSLTFIYEKKPPNSEDYEVIYEVKFYSNEIDINKIKTLSGNPGYIKGKPIITNFFKNRVFSGVSNGSCVKTKNNNNNYIYEDDIIENTFTFEDSIIYGCNNEQNLTKDETYIYENIFLNNINNVEFKYFKKGNPNNTKDLDNAKKYEYTEECRNCQNNHIQSLDILYEAIGAKNNTQNQILSIRCYCDYNLNRVNNGNRRYIKVNFYKVQSESEWWHAPGWKWVLPRNIMYPFRIGTTDYEEKN